MTVNLPESVVNSRFQITERPMTAPGKCAVCGTVERPVLDFGLDIDYYGAVLFCTECIFSAADAMGQAYDRQAPTPVGSRSYADWTAINEYVRTATDATKRLVAAIDAYGGNDSPVRDEQGIREIDTPNEIVDGSNDSDAGELLEGPEQEPLFTLDERPSSVSANSGLRIDQLLDL